jgi:hypothetical protein
MSDKNSKELRKQLRHVVGEILPDLMKDAMYAKLSAEVRAHLEAVAANVKETLSRIDERSKDIQSYIVRQSLIPTPETLNADAPKLESDCE